MLALRMNDGDWNSGKQPKRYEALLAVGEPIILEGIRDACKDKHSIHEIQAVLLQICGALSF
jgi:hypothetical protein